MTYDRAWLETEWAAGTRPEFLLFWGHQSKKDGRVSKSCFSQWFVAPIAIDGSVYPTTEHWMMASKARLFDDATALEAVFAAETPKEAKAAGRAVRGFDVDRWDAEKRAIVTIGNRAKFTQHPDLGEFLLGTGDVVIVEASPYDDVWGIGLSSEDADAVDPTKWRGENLLGFVLMDVRDTLRGSAWRLQDRCGADVAEIINLNKARKARARADARSEAAANRAAHGRSKGDRGKTDAEKAHLNQVFDGARIEHPEEDEPA